MLVQEGREAGKFTSNSAGRRVLVTGSRTWRRPGSVHRALDVLLGRWGNLTVVHGQCPTGADAYAARWAWENEALGVLQEPFPADWKRWGAGAGPLRNALMVRSGPDLALVFANPCHRRSLGCPSGEHPSHGTADCVRRIREAGVPVRFAPQGLLW